MPGGTRRAYFESSPAPDWRKRTAWEANRGVFTPAELRQMGFDGGRTVIIVLPHVRSGRKVKGYRRRRD